jgi:hypothetical protein
VLRIRLIALAAIAVVAASAAASTSASAAEPELVNSAGKELVKAGFKGKGGTVTIQVKEVGTISCETSTLEGRVTSLKGLEKKPAFTGCTLNSVKCNTSGSGSEVSFGPLSSVLVYEIVEKTLEPATLIKLSTLKIACGAQKFTLGGSVLILVSPAKTLTTQLTIVGKQKGGVQASIEYEETKGGSVKEAVLRASGEGTVKFTEAQVGLGFEAVNTYEEQVELRA